MSLRALIRIAAAALAAVPLGLLFVPALGPWPLLAGPALLLLAAGGLALSTGPGPTTRWGLRYHLPANAGEETLDTLEKVLAFLVDRGRRLILEAGEEGLSLLAPRPLDRYVEVQLPRALPEGKVAAVPAENADRTDTVFLATRPLPAAEVLRWATLGEDRRVRLHVKDGGRLTLLARGARPPGPWLPVPGPLARLLWSNAPLWDEPPAGATLAGLLPTTRAGSTFSSRSRLHELALPAGYRPGPGRCLGHAGDGHALAPGDDAPLFLAAPPPRYLARLAVEDQGRGLAPIVVSPHRPVLERIARRVATCVWIDAENSITTHHLALVPAAEWQTVSAETATRLAQQFLAGAGVDLSPDATRAIVQYLTYTLATSARLTGNDFSFVDLYAVSQGIQTLRAFLRDLGQLFPDEEQAIRQRVTRFEALLNSDAGYVQAVTALSAIRAALKPLRAGPLHNLAQPPYLDVGAALAAGSPILAPLTNRDFPEYDRLLCAMLDLTLARVLATPGPEPRFALHLHEPRRHHHDGGESWIDAARTGRISTAVAAGDRETYAALYARETGAEVIFSCPAPLATALIREEALPCTIPDLVDLPEGTAIARLPGLPLVALKTEGER